MEGARSQTAVTKIVLQLCSEADLMLWPLLPDQDSGHKKSGTSPRPYSPSKPIGHGSIFACEPKLFP